MSSTENTNLSSKATQRLIRIRKNHVGTRTNEPKADGMKTADNTYESLIHSKLGYAFKNATPSPLWAQMCTNILVCPFSCMNLRNHTTNNNAHYSGNQLIKLFK
jgi:hypothetical protein